MFPSDLIPDDQMRSLSPTLEVVLLDEPGAPLEEALPEPAPNEESELRSTDSFAVESMEEVRPITEGALHAVDDAAPMREIALRDDLPVLPALAPLVAEEALEIEPSPPAEEPIREWREERREPEAVTLPLDAPRTAVLSEEAPSSLTVHAPIEIHLQVSGEAEDAQTLVERLEAVVPTAVHSAIEQLALQLGVMP